MNNVAKTTGLTLASAAAALFFAGAVAAPSTAVAGDAVKCMGVNSCKGTGACKTATNECKGHNACKGQGFTSTSAKECAEKGGTVLK